MTKRQIFRAAIAIAATGFMLSAPALAAAPSANDARALVDGFHAELLTVMKQAKTLGMKGRFARLEPEVARRFDTRIMIAIATGKYWRSAKPDQRNRLAAAFLRYSAASYASRFSNFSGESFETLEVRDGPRKTRLVRTHINRPDDTPVALTYVTRTIKSERRIIDVLVDDGISELAVKRSEYRTILATNGVDELIRLLDKETEERLTE